MQIKAASRILAMSEKPMRKFAIYVNNGFAFDLQGTIEAPTLMAARKEYQRLNEGFLPKFPPGIKAFKLKDVTGQKGWD